MSLTTTTNTDEVVRVLRASLYPGAKTESIELVLSYCRVNGLDPMLKPVHIVPTSVKNDQGGWETRDVLMPGIADYRIKAARSGEYIGKSEPVFGPLQTVKLGGTTATFPEWCQITVYRMVNGQRAEFPAREYWMENYATKRRDDPTPNAMWQKRAYGQLAKCAEAQALRMAFPEFSGGAPTAEEMEGKTLEGVVLAAETVAEPVAQPEPPRRTARQFLDALEVELREATTWEAVSAIAAHPDVVRALDTFTNGAHERLSDMLDAARERTMHEAENAA